MKESKDLSTLRLFCESSQQASSHSICIQTLLPTQSIQTHPCVSLLMKHPSIPAPMSIKQLLLAVKCSFSTTFYFVFVFAAQSSNGLAVKLIALHQFFC